MLICSFVICIHYQYVVEPLTGLLLSFCNIIPIIVFNKVTNTQQIINMYNLSTN
jgi:hypothetical protein